MPTRRTGGALACALACALLQVAGGCHAGKGAPGGLAGPAGEAPGGVLVLDAAGVALEMKWVPAGSFAMGSPESEEGRRADEGPPTWVTHSEGFWLGTFEVTQRQWQALMGDNPARFKGADHPVENVSWNDAMEFCRRLTARERAAGRLAAGWAFTLPTEAQWEYACRAGTTTRFNTGDDESALARAGWYGANSSGTTQAVGQKEPNAWGLHDLHGNAREWCLDWYGGSYPGGSVVDPRGPAAGDLRVSRGGSWGGAAPEFCRCANRSHARPADARDDYLGFRVALSRVP